MADTISHSAMLEHNVHVNITTVTDKVQINHPVPSLLDNYGTSTDKTV